MTGYNESKGQNNVKLYQIFHASNNSYDNYDLPDHRQQLCGISRRIRIQL